MQIMYGAPIIFYKCIKCYILMQIFRRIDLTNWSKVYRWTSMDEYFIIRGIVIGCRMNLDISKQLNLLKIRLQQQHRNICFAKVEIIAECRVDKSIWSEIRIYWDTKNEECQVSSTYYAGIRNIAFVSCKFVSRSNTDFNLVACAVDPACASSPQRIAGRTW